MEVAAESDYRNWAELLPDTLGVIFTNLSLQVRLTAIRTVCKSWKDAIDGSYCWQEIDIEEWSRRSEPRHIERMLEMLITRSSGCIRKICVSGLQTERMFNLIAENAGPLKTLRLPRCSLTDDAVELITGRLSKLSVLDLSYCTRISAHVLEIVGKNCKLLEVFCRNMHPLDTSSKPLDDAEALAIASNMPKLKHLEMAYHLITNDGVLQILSSCPKLEFFEMRGCWGVKLDTMNVKQDYPNLKVMGPQVLGYYDRDDCSDISDSSDWDDGASDRDEFYGDETDESYDLWDDGSSVDELEFRVYEGVEDAGIYWPPSP